MQRQFIQLAILLAVTFAAGSAIYTVREGEQVIITQFGKPVGKPVLTAGLHFRIPYFHKVRRFEKRILNWDGEPTMITTKGNKYIISDTTARWRIVDPLKFLQTLQNEQIARTRLDDILDGATREIISAHRLVEVVRNTNDIVRKKEAGSKAVLGELEEIEKGREKLSQEILRAAQPEVVSLGIELIDIQLKRISYEKSVEKKVYERMISEQQRIAEEARSIGRGEFAKIQGKISKDLQLIESEAYQKAQEIRGKAEAAAISVYAEAFERDPALYQFLRTIEAYKKGIKPDTKLLLSTDSIFFNLLKNKPTLNR